MPTVLFHLPAKYELRTLLTLSFLEPGKQPVGFLYVAIAAVSWILALGACVGHTWTRRWIGGLLLLVSWATAFWSQCVMHGYKYYDMYGNPHGILSVWGGWLFVAFLVESQCWSV